MAMFPKADPSYALTYAREAAMIEASETISTALEQSGMTRAALARALNVSPSEITARLQGERNITVRKLAETIHVLGGRLEISAADLSQTKTNDVFASWVRRSRDRRTKATSYSVPTACSHTPARLEQFRSSQLPAS
jgi:transcriptional regulator with XRE-family HTH domain